MADRNDFQRFLHRRRNLGQVLFILGRDQHGADAAAQRREQLFLEAADRQHAAAQRDLAGHGDVAADRNAGQGRDHRRDHADAGRRPVLGHRAFGQVDVDVLAREDRRLDAIGRRARLDEAHRRLDQFLHHFAELAGGLDLALAGHGDRLDRQQFAADLGPGEAGDRADLVLFLADAVAEAADAEKIADIVGGQRRPSRSCFSRIWRSDLRATLASSRSSVRTPASRV